MPRRFASMISRVTAGLRQRSLLCGMCHKLMEHHDQGEEAVRGETNTRLIEARAGHINPVPALAVAQGRAKSVYFGDSSRFMARITMQNSPE